MTIAIVIGTHGWAAEQLLKTAEMLLGEQENVGWIDFVPGENAETLIEKYTDYQRFFPNDEGYLFTYKTDGTRINVPTNKNLSINNFPISLPESDEGSSQMRESQVS